MKNLISVLLMCFLSLILSAQQELHIHHINIENGDATMIGIYDLPSKQYTSKILIDGGQSSAETWLLPYIRKMVGTDEESSHFEYIILSHYHKDHYFGLLAIDDGRLTADSIIDPGGYRVSAYFNHTAPAARKPDSLLISPPWLLAIKTAARHTPVPFVNGRSKVLRQFGTTTTTHLGNKIVLGTVGGNDVELQCIAGWGNTLSGNGEIVPNPKPKKSNPNNFTLAFILTCGEFRYFIGGDMGGKTSGQYINQETAVASFLKFSFPRSVPMTGWNPVEGHICGFKSNHHGSDHSNEADFIESMHPAITVTSAGSNASWHLPHPNYLTRLAEVKSLNESTELTDSIFNRGVYFTNLYNWPNFPSKTRANDLFKDKPGISYDYGNNTSTGKGSYLIRITGSDLLDERSSFEVGRVDISQTIPYRRLALFFCHAK